MLVRFVSGGIAVGLFACATSVTPEDDGGVGGGGASSSTSVSTTTGSATTTGGSSTTGTASTTSGAQGGGGMAGCLSPSDCPGQDEACRSRTCEGGSCGFANEAVGVVCGPTSCAAGVEVSESLCDGLGNCEVGASQVDCEPYVCDAAGALCLTSCATSSDCAMGYTCNAGACESTTGMVALYGNVAEFGDLSMHAPDYLLGSKLTLPVAAQLTHLGVITKAAGPDVKLALYTDSGGLPGALVASTSANTMTLGTMEIPVTQVALAAGDYWIMGNYSASASIGFDQSDSTALVAYISLPFASAPPAMFPAPLTYTGQRFNYYIRVLQ